MVQLADGVLPFISGHKLDNESALDVSKHGKHFYLLVHNYKVNFKVCFCLHYLFIISIIGQLE